RLGDVHVAFLDQRAHLAVEERQQQGADVRAVDVGVGHDDDLVVAQLREVEVVAEPRAERGDHRANLFVGEHLVDARLLDVEDLPAQRQDRLRVRVSPALGGAARRIALDQEELGLRGVGRLAVDQLPGQTAALEHVLAAREVAGFLRRFSRARGLHALVDDRAPELRVLLEEEVEPFADERVDDRPDLRVAQLRLRLAFELRLLELHRDDRGEPFHAVVGRQVRVVVLEHPALARVVVHLPRHGGAEAGEVHAAFDGVDVVRVRVDDFVVTVGPLESALDDDVLAFAVRRDDRRERLLVLVEPLHERDDPALVQVRALLRLVGALVAQRDRKPAVEEGQLAQPVLQDLPREVERLEDLGVRLEPLVRAAALGATELLQLLRGDAALEADLILRAVALHARDHPLGERVHDRDPDAVEAARNLVAAFAELPAGMEDRHDDLDGRQLLLGVDVDRDPAAVVLDGARAVLVEDDRDVLRVSRERFVDGVVHGFVDELVEPPLGGVADIHAGALANSLEAFEDLDLLAGIVLHSRSQTSTRTRFST